MNGAATDLRVSVIVLYRVDFYYVRSETADSAGETSDLKLVHIS